VEEISTPSDTWFLIPIRVYSPVGRFCRTYECDQQTHRQTDSYFVCSNRLDLAIVAMHPKNDECSLK